MKKNIRATVVAFILLSGVFLVWQLHDQEAKESDAVRVVISGRIFKIPKGYLDGQAPSGKDTQSVFLAYSLPGYEVLPTHPEHREERQKLINESRMRGMLLEKSDDRPSFDHMVESNLMVNPLLENQIYPSLPTEIYGLKKYAASRKYDAKEREDDLYVERDHDNHVISFLRCSPDGKVKFPACTHKFRDKGLLYQISWSIDQLSHWKEQRDSAIEFIDSLEVKSTATGKE